MQQREGSGTRFCCFTRHGSAAVSLSIVGLLDDDFFHTQNHFPGSAVYDVVRLVVGVVTVSKLHKLVPPAFQPGLHLRYLHTPHRGRLVGQRYSTGRGRPTQLHFVNPFLGTIDARSGRSTPKPTSQRPSTCQPQKWTTLRSPAVGIPFSSGSCLTWPPGPSGGLSPCHPSRTAFRTVAVATENNGGREGSSCNTNRAKLRKRVAL